MDDFTLTNLELRESTETGEEAAGLSHASMKGMLLLTVLELAPRGEPRGAVTVVHDAGDTGDRYRDVAAVLASRGWAVALPDLRGHGRTEGERGHSAGLMEIGRDLDEIQNHLAYRMPDEPKVLVGQGLGALHALSYAISKPGTLAGLVLVAPLHEPRFEAPEAPGGMLSRLMGKKLTGTSPGSIPWTGDQLVRGAAATAWESDPLTHTVITARAQEQAMEAARDFLPRLSEVDAPVLILHGADDALSDVELSRSLAAEGVEVQVLEGLLHHPLQGDGSDVAHSALADWLDRNVPVKN
jgi:alpha-beta hydrolase superfamily lysophospholipase